MKSAIIQHAATRLRWVHEQDYNFDLGFWGASIAMHGLDEPEPECGFTGCFMGWAAHAQWFEPWGLKLLLVDERTLPGTYSYRRHHGLVDVVPPNRFDVGMRVGETSAPEFQQFVRATERDPGEGTRRAVNAVAHLFGIRTATLEKIIYSEYYLDENGDEYTPTAEQVAQRLESLIELGEEEFINLHTPARA